MLAVVTVQALFLCWITGVLGNLFSFVVQWTALPMSTLPLLGINWSESLTFSHNVIIISIPSISDEFQLLRRNFTPPHLPCPLGCSQKHTHLHSQFSIVWYKPRLCLSPMGPAKASFHLTSSGGLMSLPSCYTWPLMTCQGAWAVQIAQPTHSAVEIDPKPHMCDVGISRGFGWGRRWHHYCLGKKAGSAGPTEKLITPPNKCWISKCVTRGDGS